MSKMPLVEHLISLNSHKSLENTIVIGSQHILETTHEMFRNLRVLGLRPENTFLIGKCYSTSHSVWKEMIEDNIHVSPLSFYFDPLKEFDVQFQGAMEQFLDDILAQVDLKKFDKVILLDDGGFLLNTSRIKLKTFSHLVGIEHTSSGFERIKNQGLNFPVINVAKCPIKLDLVSPFIASVGIQKAFNRISTLNQEIEKVLIVGHGAIGGAFYNQLKVNYEVDVYDLIKSASTVDQIFSGCHLKKYDLVIGCTGNTSIPNTSHHLLKEGCVLFSASSSDREFDAAFVRQKTTTKITSCHEDIELNGIKLLNCGFPINFDGGRHSVPPQFIQLTRALLTAAVLQAVDSKENHSAILPLDEDMQLAIRKEYLKLNLDASPMIAH